MKRTVNFAILVLTAISILIPLNAVGADDFLKGLGEITEKVDKVVKGGKKVADKVLVVKDKVEENDGKLRTRSGIEGLKLKVKSCDVDEDGDVIIVFTLKNSRDYDATCQIREGDSEAYDDEGNCYTGERTLSFARGKQLFEGKNISAQLPSGVAVRYRMRIRNVDPAAVKFDKIKIHMYELPIGSMTGNVYITNLPINRDTEEEEEVEID